VIRKSIERKSLPLVMAAVAVAALLAAVPLVAQPQGPGGGPGPGGGLGPGLGPGDGHCFAAGGGPGHRGAGFGMFAGRGFERLARFLELTEEQRTQAQAIHQATREQAQPLMEQNRTLHGELRDLLAQPSPDATVVGDKMIAIHANRAQVREMHENARAQFEALLTPEQLDKLAAFEERRQDRRGRRGGGGPRGGRS
jgi:Spy/CpxP family protein refolding chaperone